jgi:hypothetical protein
MLGTRSDGRTDGHRTRCALSPRCSDARRWSLLSGPRAAPRQARRRCISSHGLVTARAVSVQLLGCYNTQRRSASTRPWTARVLASTSVLPAFVLAATAATHGWAPVAPHAVSVSLWRLAGIPSGDSTTWRYAFVRPSVAAADDDAPLWHQLIQAEAAAVARPFGLRCGR